MFKTLIPAYGRDYKSAKAAKECFLGGNDWIIADISDPYDGKPCSIRDFESGTGITLRYKQLRSLTTVKVPAISTCATTSVPTRLLKKDE
jgi:hypothetical protein